MERVTGIEPASPAWKAGALAIVLHPHAPSVEIVSLVIIAYEYSICQEENPFPRKVFSSFSLRGAKKCGMIGRLTSSYTQRYRSGHNGADSKSVWSNPRGFESHPLRQKRSNFCLPKVTSFFIQAAGLVYHHALACISSPKVHPPAA